MRLPILSLEHTALLHLLLWATLALAALLLLLVLLSAGVQARADRINNRRILLFREWEEGLPKYLYLDQTREEAFGRIEAKDLGFFQTFLGRYRSTLGGDDAKRLRTLYRDLGLEKDLPRRLTHRNPVVRAQAAMEIQSYGYAEHLGLVEKLLDDPKPFVAFAAARTLGALHGIDYAPHVFDWVQRQEDYQQDRLLELLEDFGPGLLRWLETHLAPVESNPVPWRLYALLAAGMRDEESLPTLRGLLDMPEVELQAAVLRAMGALGDLSVWEEIRPFFHAPAPALRLHAARAAGLLGHLPAVDELVKLLADPVYEVRREAGTSLMALGNLGWETLEWIAEDPSADRFARDMALERLDWGAPVNLVGEFILMAAQWGILLYFLLLHGIQFLLILKAFFAIRNYQGRTEADPLDNLFETTHALPITLVCPAFNESAGVVASVSSLISLRYPEFQVVVVNDGSTDDTVAQLVAAFRMKPTKRVIRQLIPTQEIRAIYESPYVRNLVVVDKANGGKADALNCGINVARYHLVCCMDADSLLEPDALLRVVRPFLDEPNTAACGGVIRPLNGCRVTSMGIRGIFMPDSWLARFQVVEYLRAFLFGRMGLSSLGALFIVSGAFGLFRKDILVRSGGFCTDIVGEDFEMVVRLHRLMLDEEKPYQISLVPDPICWTEAPEHFKILRRQRSRWQRGLMETLWMHRRMWFNPGYGRIGLFSMPYFLLFEAIAPFVELLGYGIALWAIWTHTINTPFALLFLWMALLLGIFNSVVAVVLQEITLHRYQGLGAWSRLLLTAVLENFGYRQLTLLWRVKGALDFIRGKRSWGRMDRYGLKGKEETAPPSAL